MNNAKSLNIFFSNNKFLGSFTSIMQFSNENLPEYCFVGRSNVGKSSIINALTKSKKLAKTSKKPGRTQSINLFKINNKINLVDLPGYGYAKVSKIKRDELSKIIESYIIDRKNLYQIFVLIDCKVGIKNIDVDMLDTISETGNSFSFILTKIDKCANKFVKKQIESILSLTKNYKKTFNKIFATSSNKNIGIIDIQKEIYESSKI